MWWCSCIATLNVFKESCIPSRLCIDGGDEVVHGRVSTRERLIQCVVVSLSRVIGAVKQVISCTRRAGEVPKVCWVLSDPSVDKIGPERVELLFIPLFIEVCAYVRNSFDNDLRNWDDSE